MTTPTAPAPKLTGLTPREQAAIESVHCTVDTCLARPGQMCQRRRGFQVQLARTLKKPHHDRLWAFDRLGRQEDEFLAAQAHQILQALSVPVTIPNTCRVLGRLRTLRLERPRGRD